MLYFDEASFQHLPMSNIIKSNCPAFVLQWSLLACLSFFFGGCSSGNPNPTKEILHDKNQIRPAFAEKEKAEAKQLSPDIFQDTLEIKNAELVREIYLRNNNQLLWSSNGILKPETDSLLHLVTDVKSYGFFPSDYNQQQLARLKERLQSDSTGIATEQDRNTFDQLSTAAFVQFVKDLRFGRLQPDSILVRDSLLSADFFLAQKDSLAQLNIHDFTKHLEPAIKDYRQLKLASHRFLRKANLKRFTLIRTKDSLLLPKLVYKRITEEDTLKIEPVKNPDSLTISKAVAKYQKWKKLKVDGKVSASLISKLNDTELERFIRIAITLDKYKLLPALPEEYLWVNIPAYSLELRKDDTVRLRSKIICGKPITQTPQLTSAITDMITYPQWTIPESIIKKEILPGLQRDPGYTRRKGFSLVDSKGDEVNPYSVKWSKYKNVIPYKVVQGSGDDNALGVMKFNFSNPYAVYLHDTNQRYLFSKSSRALSHGCVRVQQWKELAVYLLRKEQLLDSNAVSVDSLNSLLAAKKKKVIRVKSQLPLFIRYFSCEGKDGKLVLHEDIYEEDKRIRERVFASK